MDFASIQFAVFLLLILTAYWALSPRRAAQKWLLLVASAAFYASFNPIFLTLLFGISAVDYYCGKHLLSGSGRSKKLWLSVGLSLNLGMLGVFKYYTFFRESLDDLLSILGLQAHLPILQVLLPIGISFYTFQGVAYLLELRKGDGYPAKSLLDFLLFMSFFPQLLIGPICRSRQLLPQIEAPAPARVEYPSYAVSLILSGLFKRVVLASLLFTHGISETFFSPENYSSAGLWVAMVGYSIQIYCDFSGYTDLMRGFGLLFGFRLPDNFNGPYAATSIGDFWRRWHMTFGAWLRDFIYFPLGGSRKRPIRVYFNLFVTMFVCGIWHGASWGFVIWGSIHGGALVLHKLGVDVMRARGVDPRAPKPVGLLALGWVWTFSVSSFSRIFFYSPDLESAAIFIQRMFTPQAYGVGFDAVLAPAIVLGLLMNFVGTPVRRWFVNFSAGLSWLPTVLFWLVCFLLILALRPHGIAPHVYFRF
jgi:D-alanyl-lipoteichoic acid acyltransferase DltB (MBOAT superfamily)